MELTERPIQFGEVHDGVSIVENGRRGKTRLAKITAGALEKIVAQ